MSRTLACALSIGVIVIAGVVNGILGGRWESDAVERDLDSALPNRLPSWDFQAPDPKEGLVVPPKAGEFARVTANYVHRTHRTLVSVLLVRGEAGPMAYNPLICYDSHGYSRAAPVRRRPVPETPDSLWEADLIKGTDDTLLRVRWGWGADGTWHTPDDARTAFWRNRELYKLYVVSTADPNVPADADPLIAFLAEFVPALRQNLNR